MGAVVESYLSTTMGGANYDITSGTYDTGNWFVRVYTAPGVYVDGGTSSVDWWSGYTPSTIFTVSSPSSFSGCVASNWICSAASIRNDDSVWHNYAVKTNGGVANYVGLYPGDSLSASYCATNAMQVTIVELNSDMGEVRTVATGQNTTNTAPANPAATGIAGQNSGAIWSGGTTNIVGNTNVGDSAIFDAIVKLGEQMHSDLTAINANVDTPPNVTVNPATVSNYISLSVTNHDSIQTNQADILQGWAETRGRSLTNGLNLDAASAGTVAASHYSSGVGQIESVESALTGPVGTGGGARSTIEIPVGGFTMTIDPFDGQLGAMWDFAFAFAQWILVAGFLFKVVKEASEFVGIMAATHGTSAPSGEFTVFGIGGAWGQALIPILVVATLATLSVLLGAFAVKLAGYIPWVQEFNIDPTAGYGGAVATGILWLKTCFPFETMFTLATSYLVFRLAMLKASVICVFVTRALPAG